MITTTNTDKCLSTREHLDYKVSDKHAAGLVCIRSWHSSHSSME